MPLKQKPKPPKSEAEYVAAEDRLLRDNLDIYPCQRCKWPKLMMKPCTHCGADE